MTVERPGEDEDDEDEDTLELPEVEDDESPSAVMPPPSASTEDWALPGATDPDIVIEDGPIEGDVVYQAPPQLPALDLGRLPPVEVDVPRPAPVLVTLPTPPAATLPQEVDDQTAELADLLLTREGGTGWKRTEPAVSDWQRANGLVVDGKFGPRSALFMAEEFGSVPIVRFWPRNSAENVAVPRYQADLLALAEQAEEPRRSQLRFAAEREQGQAYERNPGPVAQRVVLS